MRRVTSGLAVLLTLPVLGCTDSGESAEDAADRLAAALAARDLGDVPVTDQAARAELADLVEPLEDASVEVAVRSVTSEDEQARVELSWQWDVEGHAWGYDAVATLVDRGERWALRWEPSVVEPSLTDGEQLAVDTLEAPRGDIVGARGDRIVTERPVVRYGLDKARLKSARVAASARRVAQVLDLDVGPYVRRARASGEQAFVEALVLRQEDAREEVPPAYAAIPGAIAVDDRLPLAPTREFAAPILGTVGEATAEIVEESDGEVEPGDEVGAVPGDDSDDDPQPLFRAEPAAGRPLRLTLDVDLQQRAEQVLAESPATRRRASAIVAIQPSSGDLLVAADGPGNGGLNAATYGQYAPGSTFKVVSSLALLRAGLSPTSTVPCTPTATVDGRAFENYDDYPPGGIGDIPLRTAVANSCNTAFISQAGRLGRGDLAEAAAALGLGVDHDLGFPAYFGQVPPPETETGKAADLIGQGTVLASPMAMAAVAASVRAGRAVLPRLVRDHDVEQTEPDAPLTRGEAGDLRAMMHAVVTEGSGSFLADEGVEGAKTGTAEHGQPGPGGELPTHTWMIATRGDLAVAVFVETGESGSQTAGPLLEAFLR